MKAKYALGLLAAIILTSGIVLAQQTPTPPPAPDVAAADNVFSLLVDGSGFLGVYAEDITRENMGRYGLSQVRGVGVTQVVNDSPAEKAGIRKDDVIVRLDGENVTSVRKLNRLVSEIAPEQTVKVSISRGGAEHELTATLTKRQLSFGNVDTWTTTEPKVWRWEGQGDAANSGDLVFALGNSRRIGITTSELTKQLGDYFGVSDGRGVLVTSVIEGGPAAQAGLKAGDVITAVDGEKVDSTGDVSRIVNRKKEGDVTVTIIRNRSQQTIKVTPKQGDSRLGTFRTRPALGRQIVIPRIQFPEIPEMNISVPRIVLPATPAINIQLPQRIITPRVLRPRIIRTTPGPI